MSPELRVVDLFIVAVTILDHGLHLAHQGATCRTDRLAGLLEVLLALAHEPSLDAGGSH